MHLYPIQFRIKKSNFSLMGCYEGELIHRFGSNSPDWKRGTDTFPSAKFVICSAQSFRGSCSSDRFAYATFSRRERERERERRTTGRCSQAACRRAKGTQGKASSLSRSQRHRSRDQIGHLGPAAGLQSDIRRRYCVCTPCSPIT